LAFPVSQPPSVAQAARSSGPAARWIAPSTPPPPSSVRLAALTIASTSSQVMSPSTISIWSGMTALQTERSVKSKRHSGPLISRRHRLKTLRLLVANCYCADGAAGGADGAAEADGPAPPPAEDGLTDLIQAMTFQMSSGALRTVPIGGIGPTTFSEPFRCN